MQTKHLHAGRLHVAVAGVIRFQARVTRSFNCARTTRSLRQPEWRRHLLLDWS